MSSSLPVLAVALAIVATGLVAGVFLAFSDFVMRSFALVPPASGSEVMQVLNREVYRSIFLTLLIGMAVYSVLLALYALVGLEGAAAHWLLAGSALYIVGVFAVTLMFNVPMNKRLDAMEHTAPATAEYWALYVRDWTRWNTVRTVAPTLTVLCYLIAFHHLARHGA